MSHSPVGGPRLRADSGRWKSLSVLALAAALGFTVIIPGQAQAAIITALDLSTSTFAANTGAIAGDRVVGWEFSTNAEITVTDLGYLDLPDLVLDGSLGPDGLIDSHEVGIFDGSGTLLVSGTVASGTSATLRGNFRYTSVTPTTLTAGAVYVIAATDPAGGDADNQAVQAQNAIYDASINFVDARVLFPNSTLAFPTTVRSDQNDGWFGPNFLAIPEPSTALLLALGLVALAVGRRRFPLPSCTT